MSWSDFPKFIDSIACIDLLLKDAWKNRTATAEEREIANLLLSAERGKGGIWRDIQTEFNTRLEGHAGEHSIFEDKDFHREIKIIVEHLKSIQERCVEGKCGRIGQDYAIHLHQCILGWEMINKIKGREVSIKNLKVILDFVKLMIETGKDNAYNFRRLNLH